MNTAFLFPGQGSQRSGMSGNLYPAYAAAREVFDRADDVLGFALGEMAIGKDVRINSTEFTQPALYVHSLAVLAAWGDAAPSPDMVAGHSVGEFSALAAAGAIEVDEGLRLVRLRGQLMAEAGSVRPGGMAAVLGADDDRLQALCIDVSTANSLVVTASFNAPGQVVVSGDTGAVHRLVERAKEAGAKRVVRLNVSGAFHSPLMNDTCEEFAGPLRELAIRTPHCPVYLNVTARATMDPGEIRTNMLRQLTSPVLWAQTLHSLQADGASTFVEVGSGRVLSALVRRTLGRRISTIVAEELIMAQSSDGNRLSE